MAEEDGELEWQHKEQGTYSLIKKSSIIQLDEPDVVEPQFRAQFIEQELLKSGDYTKDLVIDYTIDVIKRNVSHDIYLAKEFVASTIKSSDSDRWDDIGRQFRSDRAHRRMGGVYILPIFAGDNRSGHWYVMTFRIQNNRADSWIIDSCPAFIDEHRQLLIRNLTRAINLDFNSPWQEAACQQQTEAECGPQMLWTMVMLCCGLRKGYSMEEILIKFVDLGGLNRAEAALTIRQEIATFGGGDLGLIFHNRLWPMS